jgi:hypothetical protein
MKVQDVALLLLFPLLGGTFSATAQQVKAPLIVPEDPEIYYAFFQAHTLVDLKIQASSAASATQLSSSTAALYHVSAGDLPNLTAEVRKFNVNLGAWFLQEQY